MRLTMLALGGDRCLVSIRRAISERVTSGPEGTIRANTVLAMMRPPAIQAKVNIEPPRIGGKARQKISRSTFVGEPKSAMALIASTLIRRLPGCVGFAIECHLSPLPIILNETTAHHSHAVSAIRQSVCRGFILAV